MFNNTGEETLNCSLSSATALECAWPTKMVNYTISGSTITRNGDNISKGTFDGKGSITWRIGQNVSTWVKLGKKRTMQVYSKMSAVTITLKA